MPAQPSLIRVENPIRDYAWGSTTAIPDAVGAEPTGEPQAEMWLGAHPGDPSILGDGTRLDDHLASHPRQLGDPTGAPRSGLPFLMKLLAAASPLSLQVHPSAEQAEAGFARDEAAGLDLADPLRSYKDPFHKPEIIVALTPFRALCGFRAPAEARDDLVSLMPEAMATGIGAELAAALSLPEESSALRAAFELVLSGRPEIRDLTSAAVRASADSPLLLADTIGWVGEHYGDDPGVLGAALLNRVDLAPREALYLDAGNIHAYLSGFGIEAMAPSDNVLRGGLTPKPLDITGLLEIVAFRPITPTRVEAATSSQDGVGLTSYWPPAAEFSVHLIDADAGARTLVELTGPSMLVVASGRFEVGAGDDVLVVDRGQSVFHAAGNPLTIRALEPGSSAYLTTTGRTDAHAAEATDIDHGALSNRVLAELTGNILPFWADVAIDHERGGVHGRVSDDLTIDDSVERTAVLCARVLWAFAASARVLDDPSHLATADLAYAYLTEHVIDPVHGGVFWSVDADGVVVNDRKQVYAQAFALYALAEYARASGQDAPLRLAGDLIDLIETHATDPVHGGYIEALARDWRTIDDMRLSPKELNAPKSMNTLLHVMEAYTTYVDVTGDEFARQRLAALVTTILDHVVDAEAGCFHLFFDLDWTPLGHTVSFGHDIEGAWLLVAAATTVGDATLLERAERAAVAMADAVHRHGRDATGAVLYEFEPASGDRPAHTDTDSHWWAQAEGAVGFLDAYRLTGETRFLEATEACWRFIEDHHVDRVHGDWFKVLDADRRPRPETPKVGPWECPYHHVRACLELVQRLATHPESRNPA